MIKYYKKQGFKISVVGFFQVTFYENSRSLVQKWKIVKLNNDHDGVNENGKKAIGLDKQNKSLRVHHAFLYIFCRCTTIQRETA